MNDFGCDAGLGKCRGLRDETHIGAMCLEFGHTLLKPLLRTKRRQMVENNDAQQFLFGYETQSSLKKLFEGACHYEQSHRPDRDYLVEQLSELATKLEALKGGEDFIDESVISTLSNKPWVKEPWSKTCSKKDVRMGVSLVNDTTAAVQIGSCKLMRSKN